MLLLGDRVDPWIMGQLHEFEGKSFQDVTRGDLELERARRRRADGGRRPQARTGAARRCSSASRDVLGDTVSEVLASPRLTESPACLTRAEDELGEQMRRMLAAAGRTDAARRASHASS